MFDAQDGRCAICGDKETYGEGTRKLPVDHNHTTGKVRGLLCSACNLSIGKMKEDPVLFRKAALYLERYS